MRLYIATLLLLFPLGAQALNYGPQNEDCHTTQQSGTTSLIIVPDTQSNPETAVEGNTNATILIKAGTYNVTNFNVSDGNFVANYNCQAPIIKPTNISTLNDNDWTIGGLRFDCDNYSGNCINITDNADNWIFRNNHVYETRQALVINHNASNGLVQGNEFESLSGNNSQGDLIRIGDTSNQGACTSSEPRCHTGDSPTNITFTQNHIHGCGTAASPCNTSTGNDLLSINGVGDTGVVVTDNYFTNPQGYEQFIDMKNNYLHGVDVSYNTMIGPFTGFGNDNAANSPCLIVGDIGGNQPLNAGSEPNCKAAGVCAQHIIHHNYGENCYSVEFGPSGQGKRSAGFIFGSSRYSRPRIEHNIDNNAQRYGTGQQQQAVDRGIARQNTLINSLQRHSGEICSDQATGDNFQLLKNAFHRTRIPDECSGTPDWDISDNVFSNILEGINASRLGTGNTTTTIAFGNAGNLDFTITTAAENQKGALPSPTIGSASIGNNCVLDITMVPFAANGFDHGPMSAVDKNKITPKYNGTPQTVSSAVVGLDDNLLLTVAACPAEGDTVTFDATYGWCQDSANIGGSESMINARCLAVTGQAVTNNVDTTPPPQDVFYIDVACAGNNGDGTTETCGASGPWESLEAAVVTAACSGMSPGRTLQIAGGTYRETENLAFDPACNGIIVQEKSNEHVIFDGTEDVSGETWVSVGSGVYSCDTGNCQTADEYYWRVWYDRGAGEEELDLEMTDQTCDTSLAAGSMRVEADGTLCVHLSNSSDPGSASYVYVSTKEQWLQAHLQNSDNITIRKNPSGTGTFTVRRFRERILGARSSVNQGWTIDGLVLTETGGNCFAAATQGNAGWTIINNTISWCGAYGIRLTGDTGGATITGNTITDIQVEPEFEECVGIGDGCLGTGAVLADGAGIWFATYSNTVNGAATIADNTILRVGGGYQGHASGIWLDGWTDSLTIDSNYIAHATGLSTAGEGIYVSGTRANEFHSNNVIKNNRIYDVDRCFSQYYSGPYPSQAGKNFEWIGNSCVDPAEYGLLVSNGNDTVNQDGDIGFINNLIDAQNTAPTLISIPTTGADGWDEFTTNAVDCNGCATDQDIIVYGATTVERAADCTASVDCIADWNVLTGITANVEGDTNISTVGNEPSLEIDGSSVAYNAGTTRAETTVDYADTSRPQSSAYDVGAHEFAGAATAVLTQTHFQFFDRWLAENANPLADEDTSVDMYARSFFTIRFAIKATSGSAASLDFTLWARINAGAWTEVDTASDAAVGVYIVDNPARAARVAPLTNILSLDGLTFKSGGVYVDDDNSAVTIAIDENTQAEIEYSLGVTSAVSLTDAIELRVEQDDGTDLDTYAVTPSITIRAGRGGRSGGVRQ